MAEGTKEVTFITPAEVANEADVHAWKGKIAASWKAAAEGILHVAKTLFDAREELKAINKDLWQRLQKELHDENIISDAIQKKLLVIGGKHDTLAPFASHLPPRYNAIYWLKDLKTNQLQKYVDDGSITPAKEDKDIRQLAPSEKTASAAPTSDVILARIVQATKRLKPESKMKLQRVMKQLQSIDGIELRPTTDGQSFIGDE